MSDIITYLLRVGVCLCVCTQTSGGDTHGHAATDTHTKYVQMPGRVPSTDGQRRVVLHEESASAAPLLLVSSQRQVSRARVRQRRQVEHLLGVRDQGGQRRTERRPTGPVRGW